MKILFVGDTHGDIHFVKHALNKARESKADILMQVGDFGFFPHMSWGQDFLREVETSAALAGVPVWWIDGNHDNHDELRALTLGRASLVDISPNIVHAARGTRWEWGGLKFGAFGGAFSVGRSATLGVLRPVL